MVVPDPSGPSIEDFDVPNISWENVKQPSTPMTVEPPSWATAAATEVPDTLARQGLTLVHFSAQLEPCMTPYTP